MLRFTLRRQAQAWRSTAQRRTQSTKTDAIAPKKSARQEDQVPTPNNVPTLPLWQRLGPLTRAAEAFARAQRTRPYTTQLCSSIVIFFAGDIAAQNIGGREYDPARTGRTMVIAVISSIPSYKWYASVPPLPLGG